MPRPSLDGRRTHLILTRYQDRELRLLAKETGMNVSEHIRRAVDFYLASLADRLSTKGKPQ
jgi:hypothetical protein